MKKKTAFFIVLAMFCITVVWATTTDEDIYNKKIGILIEKIANDPDDVVLFILKGKLQGRQGIELPNRKEEYMNLIIEEKKISSMNPTLEEEENLKAANYYIEGTLLENDGIKQLTLNIINLIGSNEMLIRTFDYGYMRDGEFVKSVTFENEIEDYLNEVIMFLRSPVKSCYRNNKLQLEILGESSVKENDEIVFRILNDFNYLYFFTSTPDGELEYLDSAAITGLIDLTATASIDGPEPDVSEYLIVFGSQSSLPEGDLLSCQNVFDLQKKVSNLGNDPQYAFAFVKYDISR